MQIITRDYQPAGSGHAPGAYKYLRYSLIMNLNNHYQSPEIIRKVAFVSDVSLLAGSIVDNATVISQGQEVDTFKWDDDSQGFNHNWDNPE